MRFLFKLILLTLFVLPLILVAVVFLAIDTKPTVDRVAEVTPSSIERAKRILNQNDPRKLKSGARRTVSVNAGDLDLAANYLVHQYGGGSARIGLKNGSAQVSASLRLPRLPISLFINIDATLVEQQPLPVIERLKVGKLPIASWLANWLITKAPSLFRADLDLNTLNQVIQNVAIKERAVALTYEWREGALKTLRSAVLPPEDQERIAIYQELLVSVSRKHTGKNISLIDLLMRFFQLARERTPNSDAIGENRAAILVLAVYVNGKSFDQILPDMKSRQRPVQHQALLSQRDDFAKHFIV